MTGQMCRTDGRNRGRWPLREVRVVVAVQLKSAALEVGRRKWMSLNFYPIR